MALNTRTHFWLYIDHMLAYLQTQFYKNTKENKNCDKYFKMGSFSIFKSENNKWGTTFFNLKVPSAVDHFWSAEFNNRERPCPNNRFKCLI